jgi:hypothetical protein
MNEVLQLFRLKSNDRCSVCLKVAPHPQSIKLIDDYPAPPPLFAFPFITPSALLLFANSLYMYAFLKYMYSQQDPNSRNEPNREKDMVAGRDLRLRS